MPLREGEHPTISQVYAAFDAASHRVFREAMARSRGGVVRVGDLLHALVELERAACGDVLPERWAAPPPAWGDDRPLVPMSNEPALRCLLATAFRIARAQPGADRPTISPAVLWAAVFVERRASARVDLEEVFSRLGLAIPPELRGPPEARPPVPSPAARPAPAPRPADEMIDEVLTRWLALQALPAGPQRDAESARIAVLTRQIVSAPI